MSGSARFDNGARSAAPIDPIDLLIAMLNAGLHPMAPSHASTRNRSDVVERDPAAFEDDRARFQTLAAIRKQRWI